MTKTIDILDLITVEKQANTCSCHCKKPDLFPHQLDFSTDLIACLKV